MNIALVQCPGWHTQPPHSLAILAGLAKSENIGVSIFDLNMEIALLLANTPVTTKIKPDSWSHEKIEFDWRNNDFVAEIIKKYEEFIEAYVEVIGQSADKVIGFTLQYASSIMSYELIKRIKAKFPDKIIICGGPLCFKTNEGINVLEKSPGVDAIFFGEAETIFIKVLKTVQETGQVPKLPGLALRSGKEIIDCGVSTELLNLNNTPYADYSHFDLGKYCPSILPMYMSRGCVNNCTYCNEKASWGKYRTRTVDRVISEIKYQLSLYPKFTSMFFSDSLINANMRNLIELCNKLIQENIKVPWLCQCMIRKEMTGEMFQLMKKAGCCSVTFGLESGSDHTLKLMKKTHTQKLAEEVFSNCRSAGIPAHVNVIVGYPGETNKTFIDSVAFVKKLKLKYKITLAILICCITKQSYLHEHLEELGIELPQSWVWHSKDRTNTLAVRTIRQKFMSDYLDKPQKQNMFGFIERLILLIKYLYALKTTKISAETNYAHGISMK